MNAVGAASASLGFMGQVARSPWLRFLGSTQILAALSLPFRAYNIPRAWRASFHGDDKQARREAQWWLAAETGSTATAVTRTATGVTALQWFVVGTMPIWATVVFMIGGILELAWLVVDSVGLVKTRRFVNRLEADGATADQVWKNLAAAKSADLAKHFRIAEGEAVTAVRDTIQRLNDDPDKGQERIALWEALRARAEEKMDSHRVMLVAEAVNVFAIALLLIPPAAGLGMALFTASSATMLVQSSRDLWTWYQPIPGCRPDEKIELDTPDDIAQRTQKATDGESGEIQMQEMEASAPQQISVNPSGEAKENYGSM